MLTIWPVKPAASSCKLAKGKQRWVGWGPKGGRSSQDCKLSCSTYHSNPDNLGGTKLFSWSLCRVSHDPSVCAKPTPNEFKQPTWMLRLSKHLVVGQAYVLENLLLISHRDRQFFFSHPALIATAVDLVRV